MATGRGSQGVQPSAQGCGAEQGPCCAPGAVCRGRDSAACQAQHSACSGSCPGRCGETCGGKEPPGSAGAFCCHSCSLGQGPNCIPRHFYGDFQCCHLSGKVLTECAFIFLLNESKNYFQLITDTPGSQHWEIIRPARNIANSPFPLVFQIGRAHV